MRVVWRPHFSSWSSQGASSRSETADFMPFGAEAAMRWVLSYSLAVAHLQGRLPPSLLLTQSKSGCPVSGGQGRARILGWAGSGPSQIRRVRRRVR